MKRILAVLGGSLLIATALLAAAGTLLWWNVWLFLALTSAAGITSDRLFARTPGLAEERRTAARRAPRWDRTLVRLAALGMPLVLLVAALDRRWGWFEPMPPAAAVPAFLVGLIGVGVAARAIAVNAYFSSHVRIQEDRGHSVVSAGPYSAVRHPGYAGTLLFNLSIPVILGSWAAAVPGALMAALVVHRTRREDDFLREELPGYASYAAEVRYRLVPGVW